MILKVGQSEKNLRFVSLPALNSTTSIRGQGYFVLQQRCGFCYIRIVHFHQIIVRLGENHWNRSREQMTNKDFPGKIFAFALTAWHLPEVFSEKNHALCRNI